MSASVAPLALMMACDMIMLHRAIQGACTLRKRPRLRAAERALYETIQTLLEEGIRRRLAAQDPESYHPTPFGPILVVRAPHISALSRLPSHRAVVNDALYPLGYGDAYGTKLNVSPHSDGSVSIVIDHYPVVNMRWYHHGFRYADLWRHILSLPERIRALDAEFCRSFPTPHTCSDS